MSGRVGMVGDMVVRGDARVAKSFVPGKGYVPAIDVPVRQLRELAHGGRARAGFQSWKKDRAEREAFKGSLDDTKRFVERARRTDASSRRQLRPRFVPGKVISGVAGPNTEAFAIKTGGRRAPGAVYARGTASRETLLHEQAHVAPKRSGYRLYQIQRSPRRKMAEEGRADFLSGVDYKRKPDGSGYSQAAASERARRVHAENNGPAFGRAPVAHYRNVQDRMRYAGTKVTKREKKDRSGAMVGTGTVVGTAGLLGGGVPGARPDSGRLAHVRHGTKYEASRHLVSAVRGGVFGYRADAHQSFLNRQNADEVKHGGKKTTRVNHYLRGQGTGKIGPEKKIIEHMSRGRVASNYALAGGALLAAEGLRRRKRTVAKAAKRDDFRADALVSGGATTAALGGGGSLLLDREGRKWSRRSAESLDQARAMNPKLGGYAVRPGRGRVPDVAPHRGTSAHVADHKRVFAGRSSKDTEAVGRLRGAAGQHRYFARVYGATARRARQVGLAGGLVAAAGLGEKHLQRKPRVVTKSELGNLYRSVREGTVRTPGMRDSNAKVRVVPGRERIVREVVRRPSRKQLALGGGLLVATGAGGYGTGRVKKVDITMSDREAKAVARRYDTKGPLPKGLTREEKMRAYEGRYVASGGKKAEKWKRRADVAEAGRNVGLAGATVAAAGLLAARGKRTGPVMARTKGLRRVTPHNLETAGLTSGLSGGAAELYGEHARDKRASYNNSAAGVAASALTRMRGYTPDRRS